MELCLVYGVLHTELIVVDQDTRHADTELSYATSTRKDVHSSRSHRAGIFARGPIRRSSETIMGFFGLYTWCIRPVVPVRQLSCCSTLPWSRLILAGLDWSREAMSDEMCSERQRERVTPRSRGFIKVSQYRLHLFSLPHTCDKDGQRIASSNDAGFAASNLP